MSQQLKNKWRPPLWVVVLAVLAMVLCLPFAGLYLFRFYASQLVQQTEESLLTQAAVLSAVYAQKYQGEIDPQMGAGADVPPLAPVFPNLSITRDTIQSPRPDAVQMSGQIAPVYRRIGPPLSRIADVSQGQTLAGYRFLDPNGTVIAGSAEVGLSLAGVSEIRRALGGETVSVARLRLRDAPEPALYKLSRGTRVRVFVAMPVRVGTDVIGAVYISRTPNHIFRFLYGERINLAKAAGFVVLSAALIGWVFWRFIARPIGLLIDRTQSIGNGQKKWRPIAHYGTREIENLSNSFQSLTERLQGQQDALRSYTAHVTHELKSPLTAVKGAAELLRDSDMPPAQRDRFLDNIDKDTTRMQDLLASMREFSLADQNTGVGSCELDRVTAEIRANFPNLDVVVDEVDHLLPVPAKTMRILLTHLLENAQQHQADQVVLSVGTQGNRTTLEVRDNGTGISEGNREKIMTPFFTTRRADGGTGMGLNIVKSTLEAAGGTLSLVPSAQGACFRLVL